MVQAAGRFEGHGNGAPMHGRAPQPGGAGFTPPPGGSASRARPQQRIPMRKPFDGMGSSSASFAQQFQGANIPDRAPDSARNDGPPQPQPASAGIGGQSCRPPTGEDWDEDEMDREGGDTAGGATKGEAAFAAPGASPFAPVDGAGHGGGSGGSDQEHESEHGAPHPTGFGAAPKRGARAAPGAPAQAGKRRRADFEGDEDEGYASGPEPTSDLDGHGDAKRQAIEGAGAAGLWPRVPGAGMNDEDDDEDDDTAKVDAGKAMRAKPGHLGRHANHVKGLSKAWEKDPDNLNEAQQNDEPAPTQESFDKFDNDKFQNNVKLGNAAAQEIREEIDAADVARNSARLADLAGAAADPAIDHAAEPLMANNGARDHLNPSSAAFAPLLAGLNEINKRVQEIPDDEIIGEPVKSAVRAMLKERFKADPMLFREGSTPDNLMLPEFRIDCIEHMRSGTFVVPDKVKIGGDKAFSYMSDYKHRSHIELGKEYKLQPREVYQAERFSPIIHILGEMFEYYKECADISTEGYEAYADRMPFDPGSGKKIPLYWLTPEGQFFRGFVCSFLDFDCALLGNFWKHTVMRGQSFKASWNAIINQLLWCFGEETAAGSSGHEDRKNKSEAKGINRMMKSKPARIKDNMVPITNDFNGGKGFDIRRDADRFEELLMDIQEKHIKPSMKRLIEEDDIRRVSDKNIYDRSQEASRDMVSTADGMRVRAANAMFEQAESETDPEKKKAMLKKAHAMLAVDYKGEGNAVSESTKNQWRQTLKNFGKPYQEDRAEDQVSGSDPANLDFSNPDGVYGGPGGLMVPEVGS